MNSIILDDDDDEVEPFFVKFAHPFTDILLNPDCIKRKKKNCIGYAGYHELAYLHPKIFQPDQTVLKLLGVEKNEPFFILRFNAFKAHHDVNQFGLSLSQKQKLIKILSKHGRIFVTSEREIDNEFKQFQVLLPPEKIHSAMFYAKMFLGDSQTMTSEAAVLGTPAIKCNTFAGVLSVPNELEEKYQLCYSYHPNQFSSFLNKIQELLEIKKLGDEWEKRKNIMLSEKINVTAFLVWFIENYPQSITILKNNPDYTNRFK